MRKPERFHAIAKQLAIHGNCYSINHRSLFKEQDKFNSYRRISPATLFGLYHKFFLVMYVLYHKFNLVSIPFFKKVLKLFRIGIWCCGLWVTLANRCCVISLPHLSRSLSITSRLRFPCGIQWGILTLSLIPFSCFPIDVLWFTGYTCVSVSRYSRMYIDGLYCFCPSPFRIDTSIAPCTWTVNTFFQFFSKHKNPLRVIIM